MKHVTWPIVVVVVAVLAALATMFGLEQDQAMRQRPLVLQDFGYSAGLNATTVSSPICKSLSVMMLLGCRDFRNRAVCNAMSFRS